MNGRTCAACGGRLAVRFAKVADVQTGTPFDVWACVMCGLGHTDPVPDDLQRFYGPSYHGGRRGPIAELVAQRRLRMITRLSRGSPGRRLLDVGCGDGTFLLHARAAGWTVAGTELNPTRARQAGLPVVDSIQSAAACAPLDCVTFWHSLEHLREPMRALREAWALMAPGALLLVSVPDAGGYQAKLFGRAWLHLEVPRHLFHFDERSMRTLLGRAGFAVKRLWHRELEYDLLGWSQSALNAVMPHPNVFMSWLTKRRSSAPLPERGAQVTIGALLTATAVVPTYASSALGKGGTLIVAATRVEAP